MKRLAVPLLALLLLAGCSDATLQKVSAQLIITSDAVGVVQTTVFEAHRTGLIPTADVYKIKTICDSVNKAGVDAVKITRDLSKLGPTERSQILEILKPLIAAVRDSQLALDIKDPKTKEKIRVVLLAVETGLNSTQLILAAGK